MTEFTTSEIRAKTAGEIEELMKLPLQVMHRLPLVEITAPRAGYYLFTFPGLSSSDGAKAAGNQLLLIGALLDEGVLRDTHERRGASINGASLYDEKLSLSEDQVRQLAGGVSKGMLDKLDVILAKQKEEAASQEKLYNKIFAEALPARVTIAAVELPLGQWGEIQLSKSVNRLAPEKNTLLEKMSSILGHPIKDANLSGVSRTFRTISVHNKELMTRLVKNPNEFLQAEKALAKSKVEAKETATESKVEFASSDIRADTTKKIEDLIFYPLCNRGLHKFEFYSPVQGSYLMVFPRLGRKHMGAVGDKLFEITGLRVAIQKEHKKDIYNGNAVLNEDEMVQIANSLGKSKEMNEIFTHRAEEAEKAEKLYNDIFRPCLPDGVTVTAVEHVHGLWAEIRLSKSIQDSAKDTFLEGFSSTFGLSIEECFLDGGYRTNFNKISVHNNDFATRLLKNPVEFLQPEGRSFKKDFDLATPGAASHFRPSRT